MLGNEIARKVNDITTHDAYWTVFKSTWDQSARGMSRACSRVSVNSAKSATLWLGGLSLFKGDWENLIELCGLIAPDI